MLNFLLDIAPDKSQLLLFIEFEVHGGLAPEHGDYDAHAVLVRLELLDGAEEALQRAVRDLDGVADLVAEDYLVPLHAKVVDLLVRQRDRLVGRADETGGAAHVAHEVPALVRHYHLDEHIAGEDLAFIGLVAGVGVLGDGLERNIDLLDEVLHFAVFGRLHNGGSHGVLIAGVCVDHIPLCFFRHPSYTRSMSV